MVNGQPNLSFARSELKSLQRILGLANDERLDACLRDPVFICVDVEAYEYATNKITELGITILDTKDVKDTSPGDGAERWFAKMKHVHYRPVEHATLLNRKFVKGCEEHFNFGITTFINLADAGRILNRVFSDPSRIDQAADFDVDVDVSGNVRNVLFVSHDLRGDKRLLKKVCFSVADTKNISRTFDTQVVAGSTKKSAPSLQRLLLSLGLEPVNLHNAGNDAAYTLQSLILMAVKDHASPGIVFSALEMMPKKLPPLVYTGERAPDIRTESTAMVAYCPINDLIRRDALTAQEPASVSTDPLQFASIRPSGLDLVRKRDSNILSPVGTASSKVTTKRQRLDGSYSIE